MTDFGPYTGLSSEYKGFSTGGHEDVIQEPRANASQGKLATVVSADKVWEYGGASFILRTE
ncbi:unnamed protein product [Clavelina lepadiformis]|uniref:Uncharacterized protein n=1 Tax=Clavelina lepadiformis TaxID=159417 RepID=A0ABP0G121_CLALP